MSIYKLIFNGELLESSDKNVCVRRLAKLFKKSPAEIEKNLFSGKPVVVKKTDNKKIVDSFVKAFFEAGAKLIVEQDPPEPLPDKPSHPFETEFEEAEEEQSETDALKEKIDNTPPPPPKRRKGIMTGMMILLLVIIGVGGGGYWWVQERILKVDIPQPVIEIENALATKNLIAIGYGNVEKAVELESMFLDQPDEKALIDRQDYSLVNQLLSEGIDPRKMIEQVLFSIHFEGDSPANINGYYTVVLFGRFDPGKIKIFIEKEYEIQSSQDNGRLLVFRKQNIDDCSYSSKHCLYLGNSQIIITDPGAMANLLSRLDKKAPAEINLENWRKYRENMLVSLGLFAPDHIDKTAKGFISMLLAQLKNELGPIQSGFAGVKPIVLPPGVKLDIALNADDQSWINSEAEKLKTIIETSKANLPKDLLSAASLFDNLRVLNDTGQLRIQLVFDNKLFENIGEIFGEVMGSMFSGRSHTPDQNIPVDQEQLAQNPMKLHTSYDLSKLKPFNDIEDNLFMPDWTDGPFGIAIESVSYNEESEIEILLKAEARQIENIGKDSKRISIEVTSVTNNSGEEVLKEETCGRDRNSQPAYFSSLFGGTYFKEGQMYSYEKANAEKKIRLKPGVRFADVAQLNGIILLDLPITTERFLLSAPFKEQVVQDKEVRLSFKEGGRNQLVYESSGKQDNIIVVRGLNKDKKVLASMGNFSMGRFLGAGKNTTMDFQGNVDYAEIFLVKKSKQKQYPFSLTTIKPSQSQQFGTHTYKPVDTCSLALYSKTYESQIPPEKVEQFGWRGNPDGEVAAGPFRIELYDFRVNTHWGCSGAIDIYSPVIPSVNDNLSALNIEFHEAVLPDDNRIPFYFSEYIQLRYEAGHYNPSDKENNYLKGQDNLRLDYKGDRPVKLNGQLTLMLPLTLSTIEMSSLNLGDAASESGYKIVVKSIGRGSMDFSIEGNRNRIITFQMFSEKGDGMNATVHGLEKKGDQWLLHATFSGTPAKVIMYIADQVETKSYPIQITLQKEQ